MDARLLRYYNQELRYLREQGGEFAAEFPKIASRLGMEGLEVTDPYVERLLEGCAFLAARVQLKQDAEFPRFSQRLLELVYPNFLAPIPSMTVLQVTPTSDANLLQGVTVPRDTPVFGPRTSVSGTRCQFRTAQALQLTPLETVSADYFLNVGDLGLSALPLAGRPRCGIRVRLQLVGGPEAGQLRLDRLRFYLGGQTDVATRLHELMLASTAGILVGAPGQGAAGTFLPPTALAAVGYDDADAMLPVSQRGLAGVRLLQEHFAFAPRFLFVDLLDIAPALAAVGGSTIELTFLFSKTREGLEGAIDRTQFALHCVPAINLFPKRVDRIQVHEGSTDYQVVPDRTAPLDHEVYDVTSVTGVDDRGAERRFLPMFAPDHSAPSTEPAYYTAWREPRLLSSHAKREGPRSGYIGSEVFLSLVDPNEAPFSGNLRQLAVQTRCTNRDLPVFIPPGGAYTLEAGVPVDAVRAVAGPSRPQTALREGGIAWRLLNLLSLNYLSLIDTDAGTGAAAMRDLLSRFPMGQDPAVRRQIESLQNVETRPVVRRHPVRGPIAFSRGIEVTLTVDELGHEGGSAVLFGAALHHYLARHASMNSFVETVLVSLTRGELMRWRPSLGQRPVL